jgi:hypothetical protein
MSGGVKKQEGGGWAGCQSSLEKYPCSMRPSPRPSSNSPLNFTMQKEDSPSHQNIGKCMEY